MLAGSKALRFAKICDIVPSIPGGILNYGIPPNISHIASRKNLKKSRYAHMRELHTRYFWMWRVIWCKDRKDLIIILYSVTARDIYFFDVFPRDAFCGISKRAISRVQQMLTFNGRFNYARRMNRSKKFYNYGTMLISLIPRAFGMYIEA